MCSSPKGSSARPSQRRKRIAEPAMNAEEYTQMVNHASMCHEQGVARRAEKKRLLAEQAAIDANQMIIQQKNRKPTGFFNSLHAMMGLSKTPISMTSH